MFIYRYRRAGCALLLAAALLVGQIRPQRLSLIGAEMKVRIETDGQVTIFAGANKRPIATTPPLPASPPPGGRP